MKHDGTNCPKTPHINCGDKTRCAVCGWNPEVADRRKCRIALGLPAIKEDGTA